jgi:hypothetical protein
VAHGTPTFSSGLASTSRGGTRSYAVGSK